MKSIKIGRSSANDIVIDDLTVSSNHAILEVFDDGKVFIKDLSSTNGSFVNGIKIQEKTQLFGSDIVKLGKYDFEWMKHIQKLKTPQPVNPVSQNEIVSKTTIGRSSGNDIVFSQSDISSSHAMLIKKKDRSIVIVDCGSSNGTFVNGKRIAMHTLQKGDKVLLANKYPLKWEGVVPVPKFWMPITAVVVVVIVVVGTYFFPFSTTPKKIPPETIYSTYKKSEVLIYTSFYFKVYLGQEEFGDCIITKDGKVMKIKHPSEAMEGTGTGFFISNDGKIVTNKHVVNYWDFEPQYEGAIQTSLKKLIEQEIKAGNIDPIKYLPLMNEIKVAPKIVALGIVLNDTHIKSGDELIPCTILKVSNNEIDLAIIQVNSKQLPIGVNQLVDLSTAFIGDMVIGERVFTIGFPAGFSIAKTNVGIEANHQSGEVTQDRGEIHFGHNMAIIGGASGSPVFNEYGQFVGVVNAGFGDGLGYNMAIKAKHVVDLAK